MYYVHVCIIKIYRKLQDDKKTFNTNFCLTWLTTFKIHFSLSVCDLKQRIIMTQRNQLIHLQLNILMENSIFIFKNKNHDILHKYEKI